MKEDQRTFSDATSSIVLALSGLTLADVGQLIMAFVALVAASASLINALANYRRAKNERAAAAWFADRSLKLGKPQDLHSPTPGLHQDDRDPTVVPSQEVAR